MQKQIKIVMGSLEDDHLKVIKVKAWPLAQYIAIVLFDTFSLVDRQTGATIEGGFKTFKECQAYYHNKVRNKWPKIVKTQEYQDMKHYINRKVGKLV